MWQKHRECGCWPRSYEADQTKVKVAAIDAEALKGQPQKKCQFMEALRCTGTHPQWKCEVWRYCPWGKWQNSSGQWDVPVLLAALRRGSAMPGRLRGSLLPIAEVHADPVAGWDLEEQELEFESGRVRGGWSWARYAFPSFPLLHCVILHIFFQG
jgi:hypothetical protein